MDLIDDPQPGRNVPEFSVSEVAGTVKRLIESELGYVRVRGEVGRVVRARSGHLYFDLKDDRSVLSCITWKGQIPGLEILPEEGMEVVAEGKMTASGFQSKFALNATRVAVAGEGALMAMLEKRKKALEAEGLFAAARKKPLPYLPEVIGVVTSQQGVVIRDILHRLRDRFPRKVLVWPVAVQGQACAPEVTRAIEGFNALTPGGALPRPDLIIVARGGGSIEDLWGFNEEAVVRAAAASDIPLISAVGHETDTTLIDHAADRRAPTPTAAAEIAVPVRRELLAWTQEQGARMIQRMDQALAQRGQRLSDLGRALPRRDGLLQAPRQRLDHLSGRLPAGLDRLVQRRRVALSERAGLLRPALLRRALEGERRRLSDREAALTASLRNFVDHRRAVFQGLAPRLIPAGLRSETCRQGERLGTISLRLGAASEGQMTRLRDRLDALARLQDTLGHRATLARGYAIVRGDGALVTTRTAAAKAAHLEIEFTDGRLQTGGNASGAALPDKPSPTRPAQTPAEKPAENPAAKKPAAKKPAPRKIRKSDPPEQGSLF